jgi:hypothetical protein
MPAHNEERFIAAAIESVHFQTYPPGELIIVDDGSTDRTGEIARSASGPVPVRVLVHDRPEGSIAARNWGLREAETEWVAMLDADDIWLPHKLERQFAFVDAWSSESPVAVLGTKGRHINEAGKDIGVYDPGGCDSEAAFRHTLSSGGIPMVGHSSVLFRREEALAVGGYLEDYSLGAEDHDLWDRMAALKNGVIVNVNEHLFCYRKKRGGMMQRQALTMHTNFGRVVENRNRRHRGEPPLSFTAYQAQMRQRPMRVRVTWTIDVYAAWLYRFGAMNVVNGRRALGAVQLGAAGLLRPRLVVGGIRRRFQH